MYLTRAELKENALNDLRGNWKQPVLITFVYMVFAVIFNSSWGENTFWYICCLLASTFFILPMAYCMQLAFLEFVRGEKDQMVNKLFGFFNNYARSFETAFMVTLYTFLWSLLLFVPGMIKSLAYSMTYYISKDHPEYSIDQCIEESRRMMYGHKWELFVLSLSFMGWILLSVITLGIGLLWVVPYMNATIAHYYEQLKEAQPKTV